VRAAPERADFFAAFFRGAAFFAARFRAEAGRAALRGAAFFVALRPVARVVDSLAGDVDDLCAASYAAIMFAGRRPRLETA
jgi:hypothetical protein